MNGGSVQLQVALELPLGDLLVRRLNLATLALDEVVDVVTTARVFPNALRSGALPASSRVASSRLDGSVSIPAASRSAVDMV